MSSLCCHLRPWWCVSLCSYCSRDLLWWCLWPMLLPSAIWMSIVCTSTWSHIDIHEFCCQWGPHWSERSTLQPETTVMSLVCDVTEGCDFVCGTCIIGGPRWCLWSILESMLRSMACVDAGDHVCPWSVMSPDTMCKPMIYAPADYRGQGCYFLHGNDDHRLTVEKEGHKWLWQPLLPFLPNKSNSSDKKPLKKTQIGMLKHRAPNWYFWQGCRWGRTHFSLRGWALGVSPYSNEYIAT